MEIRKANLLGLTPAKRKLVARLLAEKKAAQKQTAVLKPIAGDTFPVSFVQQAMLKHAFENPSSCNMVSAYDIDGEIDLEIFKESFNELVNRQKILRVSFFKRGETFFQRIRDKDRCQIIYRDLRAEETTPEQYLHECVERELNYEFDLQGELLFRMILTRISDDKYYLINNIHHLLTDTWSNLLLSSEFMKIYKSVLETGKNALEDPPIQYTDYAFWERDWLESSEAEKQKVFWKNYLAEATPLSLKTDFSRLESSEYSYLLGEQLVVKPEIAARFFEFCAANEITVYTGVSSVLFALLYFYSKTNDICIGTYAVLRNRPEAFSMIGYMVNDITFRATVSGAQTAADFVRHIRQIQSEAQSCREIPREIVNNLLNPGDDYFLSSLHRVLCLYSQTDETLTARADDSPIDENQGIFADTAGLPWKAKVILLPEKEKFTDRDLILSLYSSNRGSSMRLRFLYNSGLFKSATVKKMLAQFERLLTLFPDCGSETLDHILEKI